MKNNKNAFTLVEMIITASIIILLAVIWFSANQWYKQKANNTIVGSDTYTINNALEAYSIEVWNLPMPGWNTNFYKIDSTYAHSYADSETFWVYGSITENTIPKKYLDILPLDPRTNSYYAYGKTKDTNEFEIASVQIIKDYPISKVSWNYTWEKGPLNLIREYNWYNFVNNNSKYNLPYNPNELILIATDKDWNIYREWDTITTSAWEEKEIFFSDGSTSILEENSTLILNKLNFPDWNSLSTVIKLTLSAGKIWTRATHLNDNSEFEVFTSDSAAAVRWTIFWVIKTIDSTESIIIEWEIDLYATQYVPGQGFVKTTNITSSWDLSVEEADDAKSIVVGSNSGIDGYNPPGTTWIDEWISANRAADDIFDEFKRIMANDASLQYNNGTTAASTMYLSSDCWAWVRKISPPSEYTTVTTPSPTINVNGYTINTILKTNITLPVFSEVDEDRTDIIDDANIAQISLWNSCYLEWLEVKDTETATWYYEKNPLSPSTCISSTRTCNDWILAWDPNNKYSDCTICTFWFNWICLDQENIDWIPMYAYAPYNILNDYNLYLSNLSIITPTIGGLEHVQDDCSVNNIPACTKLPSPTSPPSDHNFYSLNSGNNIWIFMDNDAAAAWDEDILHYTLPTITWDFAIEMSVLGSSLQQEWWRYIFDNENGEGLFISKDTNWKYLLWYDWGNVCSDNPITWIPSCGLSFSNTFEEIIIDNKNNKLTILGKEFTIPNISINDLYIWSKNNYSLQLNWIIDYIKIYK